MDTVREGLNDDFLYDMLISTEKRLNIPSKNMGLKEYLTATKATLNTDPLLTMFVLYLRMGPYNIVKPYSVFSADSVVVQDQLHVYQPFRGIGRHTGIRRKASYQGLTVFMQKASKANAYKHMYVKDMYSAIVEHYRTSEWKKADPIDEFLNTWIEDDWYTSNSPSVLQKVAIKLGQNHWDSFYDVYLHYSMMYSGYVIIEQGNVLTDRRYKEKLTNMGETLNAKVTESDDTHNIKEFLQDCEGCTDVVEDPLVDEIMKHTHMTNANVINAFRKRIHNTTTGFMLFDDNINKNVEAWSNFIKSLRISKRSFEEDLAYRVWITRYWDDTRYRQFL